MTDAVADGFARGRAAWPSVKLTVSDFVDHVARAPDFDPAYASDFYLACACAHGDAAAARALDAHFLQDIGRYVARYGNDQAFVDDVKQALRERLLIAVDGASPKIAEYGARGPLEAWLRVCAVRTALNLRRALPKRAHEDVDDMLAGHGDPELSLLRARYGPHFREALRRALEAMDARERTLLRLHFVEGMSIDRLGAIHAVHRATAARWLIAAREHLLEDALRILEATLGATRSELTSLYGLLRSQIHLSFSEPRDAP